MGLFDWTKRKASGAADVGKKVIGTEEIKNNASFMKDMAKKLFNPKSTIKNAKVETFIEAKKRLKLNDLDIIKVYKNNVYSFYISFVFSLLCVFYVLYNIIFFNLLGIFSTIGILALCLAQSFRFSFRAFQIRHQKLCSPKDWAQRPTEWFPTLS